MKAVSYWIGDEVTTLHEATDEVVCPYCGYQYFGSYEFDDVGVGECCHCGGYFHYERNVSVIYTTQKDCELNEQEHDWKAFGHDDGVFRCSKCGKMGLNIKDGEYS